ncbi:MAG: adenylyltransferase/cytidyltransferase family protein [Candidatus Moranbacteria bacterium]|nr:adenylyltransferase/cytidyltransferase family protein [Candidatus Moranbacteria bacterium]
MADIRKKHKNEKIVFCSGCFDLTHAGHVLFFEDCKNLGDILIVGTGPDADLKNYKGEKRPILNEQLRLKMISSMKVVDYAFILPPVLSDSGNLLGNLERIFEKLRPDIYAINDDAFDIPYREKITKKLNIKLAVLKRWCPPEFENISTTQIINKIKNLRFK